ncbi:MAG: hypothetical protein ACRCUM_00060 [Mycoplasmoidaceae bacterium]
MNPRKRINEFLTTKDVYEMINGNENFDVREMLARQKINIMYSNTSLNTKNEKLKEVFDNIKKNNNFNQLLKGMERYLSKDGKAYFVWDIFEEGEFGYEERTIKLMMALPYEDRNQTLREYQQKEYAGTCVLQTTTTKQGLVQRVYQCRTPNETHSIMWNSAIPENEIPLDNFLITTPEFLKPYQKENIRVHNYNVLSMTEVYNKNALDFGDGNDYLQPDDYPVSYLREVINSYLVWIKEEQKKNGTKIIGTFSSYEDMFKKPLNAASFNYMSSGNSGISNSEAQRILQQMNNQKSILEDSFVMFLQNGGNPNTIEKLQSTFSMEDNTRGLGSLFELYFNGAGFDYSVQTMSGASQYTSTSEISTNTRRTTETVKEAILLRQEQYTNIINNIIDAWFKKVDAHKEFEGQWEFKIISNLVNEEAYSVEKIIMLKDNGLISNRLAIEKANKDLSALDLEELIKEIEKEQAEQEQKDMEMLEASMNPMEKKKPMKGKN